MVEYEETLQIAKSKSDHGNRVQEFEPAIVESLQNTDAQYPALEIGNRDGGSATLILWHIYKENKGRKLITCDTSDQPETIVSAAQRLGLDVPHHYKMTQKDFLRTDFLYTFGFIYLDADHDYNNVKADLSILKLTKGAIVAVDDVESWPELPQIDGLERIEYQVDEGRGGKGVHGHHIAFWRKI